MVARLTQRVALTFLLVGVVGCCVKGIMGPSLVVTGTSASYKILLGVAEGAEPFVGLVEEVAVLVRVPDGWLLESASYSGTIGGERPGRAIPRWKSLLNLGFDAGAVALYARWQYIDSVRDALVRDFPVPARSYVDLGAAYDFADARFAGLTLGVGIDNVGDEMPPIFPSWQQANTDPSQYDVLGRRYRLDHGIVDFDGSLDPRLDIQMMHDFRSLTLTVDIRGRSNMPDLRLASDAGAYSQSQLLSFLAGATPSEDPASQSGDAVASGSLTILSSRLGKRINKRIPLVKFDTINYEAQTASTSRAIRLGKPHSLWAKLFYRHKKQERSQERYANERGKPFWKRGPELLGRLHLGGTRSASSTRGS